MVVVEDAAAGFEGAFVFGELPIGLATGVALVVEGAVVGGVAGCSGVLEDVALAGGEGSGTGVRVGEVCAVPTGSGVPLDATLEEDRSRKNPPTASAAKTNAAASAAINAPFPFVVTAEPVVTTPPFVPSAEPVIGPL